MRKRRVARAALATLVVGVALARTASMLSTAELVVLALGLALTLAWMGG